MLLKVDPYKKEKKRTIDTVAIGAMSAGTGKSGVEFRWYESRG